MIKAAIVALILAVLPAATQAQFLNRASNIPAPSSPESGCGTAPSQAANAGFITCAANYDFSQPTYAVQSDWLDCTGSHPTYIWHWGGVGVKGKIPCNINQGIDPITGQTVLVQQWLSSYSSLGYTLNDNLNAMNTFYDSTHYIDYPNMYVEVVARLNSTFSAPSGSSGPISIFFWQTLPGSTVLETDPYELAGSKGGYADGAIHQWSGSDHGQYLWTTFGTGSPPLGYSVTAYHKYGALITSDGLTNTYVCGYIDDIFQTCRAFSPAPSAAEFLKRNYPIVFLATNFGSGNYPPTDQIQYIQYMRIWSCPNWALPAGSPPTAPTMCDGSTLVNGPLSGLTYYH